MRLVKV